MNPAIHVRDLRKVFRQSKKREGLGGAVKGLFSRQFTEVEAVKGVTFDIPQGEIVGFLGPNGAGKTTTIKMLTGIISATSGELSVLGYQPFERRQEWLRRIALVMGNKQQLWWDLPAYDGFRVLKELYDVSESDFKHRVGSLATALELEEQLHRPLRQLSLGERMKCELIAAVIHQPEVLFLDEPTIGLDVVSQKRIREFLAHLNSEHGTTMVLTSHYMQDVKELCKRIVVINKGEIAFDGPVDGLVRQYSSVRYLKLDFSSKVERVDIEKFGRVSEFDGMMAIVAIDQKNAAIMTATILGELPVIDLALEDVPIDDIIRDVFSGVSRETSGP